MANLYILKQLKHYICMPQALTYRPSMVYHDPGFTDEIRKINDFLCGENNIASKFMLDGSNAEEFFDNVKHNGPRSVPVIVRAIQIALINSK